MSILASWILHAIGLMAIGYLYPGVQVTDFTAALLAALVIGLLNTLVRPILVFVTLPVTVLTLGFFLFIINAGLFWFAAGMLDGFKVDGFVAALIGSLIYSVMGVVIDWVT